MKVFTTIVVGLFSVLIATTFFDPITIGTLIGALLLAGAVIAYLTMDDVRNWVRQNISWNRSNIAFMYKQQKQRGKIPVITGFLNETTETITAHKDYLAESVDSQISNMQTEVVYELQ